MRGSNLIQRRGGCDHSRQARFIAVIQDLVELFPAPRAWRSVCPDHPGSAARWFEFARKDAVVGCRTGGGAESCPQMVKQVRYDGEDGFARPVAALEMPDRSGQVGFACPIRSNENQPAFWVFQQSVGAARKALVEAVLLILPVGAQFLRALNLSKVRWSLMCAREEIGEGICVHQRIAEIRRFDLQLDDQFTIL